MSNSEVMDEQLWGDGWATLRWWMTNNIHRCLNPASSGPPGAVWTQRDWGVFGFPLLIYSASLEGSGWYDGYRLILRMNIKDSYEHENDYGYANAYAQIEFIEILILICVHIIYIYYLISKWMWEDKNVYEYDFSLARSLSLSIYIFTIVLIWMILMTGPRLHLFSRQASQDVVMLASASQSPQAAWKTRIFFEQTLRVTATFGPSNKTLVVFG